MSLALWQQCLDYLQDELNSQQFNTWIRPLQAEEGESNELRLLAPNRFVRDWVSDKYAKRISELIRELAPSKPPKVSLTVGSRRPAAPAPQPRDLGNPVSAATDRSSAPAVHTPPRGDIADEREIDQMREREEAPRRRNNERQVQVEEALSTAVDLILILLLIPLLKVSRTSWPEPPPDKCRKIRAVPITHYFYTAG